MQTTRASAINDDARAAPDANEVTPFCSAHRASRAKLHHPRTSLRVPSTQVMKKGLARLQGFTFQQAATFSDTNTYVVLHAGFNHDTNQIQRCIYIWVGCATKSSTLQTARVSAGLLRWDIAAACLFPLPYRCCSLRSQCMLCARTIVCRVSTIELQGCSHQVPALGCLLA